MSACRYWYGSQYKEVSTEKLLKANKTPISSDSDKSEAKETASLSDVNTPSTNYISQEEKALATETQSDAIANSPSPERSPNITPAVAIDAVNADKNICDLHLEDTNLCQGEKKTYHINIDDTEARFLWKFSDGNSYNNASPTHVFNQSGNSKVTLIIMPNNRKACPAIVQNVDVFPTPQVRFTFESNSSNSSIQFKNLTTGGATEYSWDFADGNTSTLENPKNLFEVEDEYPVTLKATNDYLCSSEMVYKINIQEGFIVSAIRQFSPNSDGFLDSFKPDLSNSNVRDYKLEIHDTSGKLIWSTINPDESWDGLTGLENLSSHNNTFLWRLTAVSEDGVQVDVPGSVRIMSNQ